MSLRLRLAILVAAVLVPFLALIAYNSYSLKNFIEDEADDDVLDMAHLVSAQLTQLFEGSRRLMIALAKYPGVPDREDECRAYFKSVIADLPIYRDAAFIDRDGKFHCSTMPIPETVDARDRLYFYEPLQTGRLTVSTLTTGRVSGLPSIHVSLPYRSPDRRIDGVVTLILDLDKIAEDIESREWPMQHRLTVYDREGAVVLRVPREQGTRDDKKIFELARDAPAGTFVVESVRGREEIVASLPLREDPQGVVVTVSTDRGLALARLLQISSRTLLLAVSAIIIAMIIAWLTADILIRRPVLRMVDTANRREAGDTSAYFPRLQSNTELGVLSTALAGMSDKVDELLEQKEFLLRELQHRVMNSLNILSSLLMLQGKHTSEPAVRDQLSRAQQRILAMGAVYRHLYSADITAHVECGEFLSMICRESERAYIGSNRPSIICDADKIEVAGSQAGSLAVLAHELITNALKHAYPEGEAGPITVRLKRGDDGIVELSVIDRGKGIPADLRSSRSSSLGFKVISATVRQFNAKLDIIPLDPGTEIRIRFPADFGAPEATEKPDAA